MNFSQIFLQNNNRIYVKHFWWRFVFDKKRNWKTRHQIFFLCWKLSSKWWKSKNLHDPIDQKVKMSLTLFKNKKKKHWDDSQCFVITFIFKANEKLIHSLTEFQFLMSCLIFCPNPYFGKLVTNFSCSRQNRSNSTQIELWHDWSLVSQ